MGKKSPPRKFSPLYQKASWVLFGIIVILQVILDVVVPIIMSGSVNFYGTIGLLVFHLGLMLIIGWAIYWLWQKASVPRYPYLGIAFALAAVNEVITNLLSVPFLDQFGLEDPLGLVFSFIIPESFGGVGDILYIVGRYALLTFIIPLLLLKWTTQGNWRKTIILALKIVGIAIAAEIILFLIVIRLGFGGPGPGGM